MSSTQPETRERDELLALLVIEHGVKLRVALSLYPQDVDLETGEVRLPPGGASGSVQVGDDGLDLVNSWLARRDSLGITKLAPLFCIVQATAALERGQSLRRDYASLIVRQHFERS